MHVNLLLKREYIGAICGPYFGATRFYVRRFDHSLHKHKDRYEGLRPAGPKPALTQNGTLESFVA